MPTGSERLIAAAAGLFARRGYREVAVAEVLEAADAVAGSLYHHFGSKEGLYRAVLTRAAADWSGRLVPAVERESPDPLDRTLACLAAHAPGAPASAAATLLLKASMDAGLPGWVGDLARDHHARRLETVHTWLAQAGPRLPADADRLALASLVLLTIDGAVARGGEPDGEAAVATSVRELRRYFDLLEERAAA